MLKTIKYRLVCFCFSIFAEKIGMNLSLILALTLMIALPVSGSAQRKRAFLVGISNYHDYEKGYRVWNNIHGAEDVRLLKEELQRKGFQTDTLMNDAATYQNILHGLDGFIRKTKKDDIVFLHFSCHGQPVEDGMYGDVKDEKDGWDEALVPIDAGIKYDLSGYPGDKHITDDTLNVYISRLRKHIGADGMLYVAMDACHAGTFFRKLETVRGTNEGLTKNGMKYNPPKDNVRHYHLINTKGRSPVLFLEACKSNERNTEIRIRGKEWGALSYNIWDALQGMSHLGKNVSEFRDSVEASTKKKKQWPRTQSLIVESSF